MSRNRSFIHAGIVALMLISCTHNGKKNIEVDELTPFAVSYEKLSTEDVRPYRTVIVEPGHYQATDVADLKKTQARLVAYISLGEVNSGRWYFPLLEKRGFLGKNKNWGSYFINLADSVSRHILVEQVVSEILSKGFDGLFLDTVDSVAPYTKRAHLQPMMLELISEIRKRYPKILIIQNAGLFILQQTYPMVDAVLVESVATNYSFQNREYRLRDTKQYKTKVSEIRKLSAATGDPFWILEFADTDSLKHLTKLRLDSLSYSYFISGIELNDISAATAKGQ